MKKILTTGLAAILLLLPAMSGLQTGVAAAPSLNTVLEYESAKGNGEARFLSSLVQFSKYSDPQILNALVPISATQSFILASLYASRNQYAQAGYFLEQVPVLLQNRGGSSNVRAQGTSAVSSKDELGRKYIWLLGQLSAAAGSGSQEAGFLLQITPNILNESDVNLQSIHATTASEAFLLGLAYVMVKQRDLASASFNQAAALLSRQPVPAPSRPLAMPQPGSRAPVMANRATEPTLPTLDNLALAPMVVPPVSPGASPAELPGFPVADSNEVSAAPADHDTEPDSGSLEDDSASSSGLSIPEEELRRIEESVAQNRAEQPEIMLWKGLCAYYGTGGVPKNYVKSAEYIAQSAMLGNATAQAVMGENYQSGLGVPRDYQKAFYWYQKSVSNGCKLGYNNLGLLYGNGQGTTKDLVMAEKYYKLSIEDDPKSSAPYLNLGGLYTRQKKYAQAEVYLLKAQQLGSVAAQEMLGTLYDNMHQYAKSFTCWQKVAQRGSAIGLYNVAVSYNNGEGVAQSYVKAYYYAGLAIKKGSTNAAQLKAHIAKYLQPAQMAQVEKLLRENQPPLAKFI